MRQRGSLAKNEMLPLFFRVRKNDIIKEIRKNSRRR
jgi:hypothetical protein